MEAASARYAGGYASRDRFGAFGEPANSALRRYIYNACDPQNMEPNLALNLEVSDLINSKKGNAPREAALTIVQLINSRNPNESLLALALLDICVKNCGYPFHLQISTKEFLNELVRRFPERPPIRPSRVQSRILEAIEEWRQTICQTSRYKEDLGFIRDMHRLLLYKGYMFPQVRREDAAVLNPSDNLKSADEMEEEERSAQSAKLQELIRRGGPEDLQEANRLMKVMAGYDTRHKTDYRAKAAEEVSKIQQKAKILEEMLQSHKPGDQVGEGDVFEELASALQSAHPKIQKMCEEESDDSEAVAKLLEINDSIHRTVERYKLIKKGDVEAASKIPRGTLGTSTGVVKNAANELSLIDFEPEPVVKDETGQAVTGPQATTVEDDLLGLSIEDKASGQTGLISLGFGANGGVPGPPLLSSTMQQNFAASPTTAFPIPPQPPQPNSNALSSLTSLHPSSKPASPPPIQQQQQQQQQQHKPAPPPQAPADPFAALIASSSRSSSPFSRQPTSKPGPASTPPVDLTGSVTQVGITSKNGVATEDEWSFASALPEKTWPTTNRVKVHSSTIKIEFLATRPNGEETIRIKAQFSNNTAKSVHGLHFQVAVEKGYSLQLKPQSGRDMAGNEVYAIEQEVIVNGVPKGQGNLVKMRFKVSYQVDQLPQEEQGVVPPLGIA
ncbi:hypothetical protein GJ744_001738 [Endocarpon pusillum]|uniref:VHS domain-containing protein n=1 Tax=Endocarpon pusillum TaxID=364733 RepID=A0A8H7E0Z1_9EURO|nr:hypothetical protein GJ744_001738 [Endocarpon pusillum]